MAKKETQKTEKKAMRVVVPELPDDVKKMLAENENELRTLIAMLDTRLNETNKRIDRIIMALDKSKSVRGL